MRGMRVWSANAVGGGGVAMHSHGRKGCGVGMVWPYPWKGVWSMSIKGVVQSCVREWP